MGSDDRGRQAADDSSIAWGSTARSVASLILFMHLFFVAVTLAANHSPSPLQDRLLTVFRPYTQLLNFDVTFVRFDLTQATADDTDQRIDYLPEGKDPSQAEAWVRLQGGIRGGESYARYQRFAALLGFVGSREDNSTSALLAQSVGTHLAQQANTMVSQVRCRRHLLQSPDDLTGTNVARRHPDDPSFFVEAYRAQVVVDPASKQVLVQKVEERSQVAPPTRASGRPAPGRPDPNRSTDDAAAKDANP